MNQNNTLRQLLHSLLLAALAVCSTGALAQNRPVTQYFYDANGNLTSTVDGLNRVTTQSYDALDRLRRITQPPPGAMQPNPVIQLDLNGRDDLTRVIDPRNLATDYSVSGLSDVTSQTSPDTGLTSRTFDAAGNVLTSRDARGRTTSYTYDALHRLTRARYGDGTSSNYSYDQGANGIGRLTGMTDPGPVSTAWSYTAMGRVATKAQTVGSGTSARTHQLSYSYNPATGQLISMTYPSGKIITYTYGAASKDLESIAFNGTPIASAITYHPFGGVKRFTLGNGRVWSNSLDQDGRVRTYTLGGVTHTIAWDAANRIIGITSSQTTTNRSFGYDNLDRITGFATTGRSQSFVYDLTGNLLAKADVVSGTQTDTTYSIDPASNRMTGIANLGIGYSFDAAGNRTGDGRITYAYNQRGRMNQVRITNGATTQTFNYLINGVNLRVRKTGPSSVVPQGMLIFVYDDQARLIGEYDNLGRARTEHIWLEERPLAAVKYNYSGTSTAPTSTTVFYVETDHLATPRLITNASRQKRWSWDSAPYGDTLPNSNPAGLGTFTYDLRFAGQYFDKETNHHYNHHRDYESTTGRYLQSDPIGLEGGWNTYLYVDGDPTASFDVEGLQRRPLPQQRTPPFGGGTGLRPAPSRIPASVIPAAPIRIQLSPGGSCGPCLEVFFVARTEGHTRGQHRRSANHQFYDQVIYIARNGGTSPSGLSGVQQHMESGRSGLRNPHDMVWHHPTNRPNELWLIRTCDHTNPTFQPWLHPLPGRGGGFAQNF